MLISETYRCARALEALENYARADGPLVEEVGNVAGSSAEPVWIEPDGGGYAQKRFDERFWSLVSADPDRWWGQTFRLSMVGLSEWVARVPGLFWSTSAKGMRALAKGSVEHRSDRWVTYKPIGKSAIVLGGIGTIKFPPNENGCRLVTLSGGHNASSGIPALVFPEVWEYPELRGEQLNHLQEGDIITVKVQWQPMAWGWAQRFPSVRGIPRGYLVLRNPENIHVDRYMRSTPTEFHPCTVMEYESGDTKLWDFVYATVDTRVDGYRAKVENFFTSYKDRHERRGRYLFSADISNPMWEADHDSPASLRLTSQGKTQLKLLEERVRRYTYRGRTVEEILQLLAQNYSQEALRRLATYINIPWGQVNEATSRADVAAQLIERCLSSEDKMKVEELLDAIAQENPHLIIPKKGDFHGLE
jgi:hypothetical protein